MPRRNSLLAPDYTLTEREIVLCIRAPHCANTSSLWILLRWDTTCPDADRAAHLNLHFHFETFKAKMYAFIRCSFIKKRWLSWGNLRQNTTGIWNPVDCKFNEMSRFSLFFETVVHILPKILSIESSAWKSSKLCCMIDITVFKIFIKSSKHRGFYSIEL